MTDEHDEGIRVEAVEVAVDYDELFAERLRVLEQMVYEFRYGRGLKEGHEDVGTFAQHRTRDTVDFTVRSLHAGHLVVEAFGSSVTIDFSSEEESLQITAGDQTSPLEADAAGIHVLTDIQKKLVAINVDSLEV